MSAVSAMQNGAGPLSRKICAAAEAEDLNQAELTVLSPNVDPYRLDTPAGHRDGAWLGEQVRRFLPDGSVIHLRGLHYVIASAGDVLTPAGTPYTNTDRNWLFLCRCGKAARWLGYVPFRLIKDERNQKPRIFVPELDRASFFQRAQVSDFYGR